MPETLCTKCHKEPAEWDMYEGNLCQMCFEEMCNEAYYKGVDEGWIF